MSPPGSSVTHERRDPLARRIAATLSAAALASIACTGHTAARLSTGAAIPWPKAWLALAACAYLPALFFVVVLPRARAAMGSFDPKGSRTRILTLLFTVAALEGTLSVFGRVLRQSTHHHALAGVTFALGALVVTAFAAALSARIASLVASLGEVAARVAIVVASLVVVAIFAVLVRSLSPSARVMLLDGGAFVVAVVLASRTALPRPEKHPEAPHDDDDDAPSRLGFLAYFGAVVAAAIIALGAISLRQSAEVVLPSIDALAPLYATLAGLIGGH